jgi:hypothetical protein
MAQARVSLRFGSTVFAFPSAGALCQGPFIMPDNRRFIARDGIKAVFGLRFRDRQTDNLREFLCVAERWNDLARIRPF